MSCASGGLASTKNTSWNIGPTSGMLKLAVQETQRHQSSMSGSELQAGLGIQPDLDL